MDAKYTVEQVRIVDFPQTRVGALAHRGDAQSIAASVERFIAWRKQNHLPPWQSATFNICYDTGRDASDTPGEVHLDICAATEGEIAANPFGVAAKIIPGGRCAVLRYVGSDAGLAGAATFLYKEWLPQSGESLRDFPLFLQRVRFFPEVPEDETVFDIFLPLTQVAA
jgi:AraC family transcriptional regulator